MKGRRADHAGVDCGAWESRTEADCRAGGKVCSSDFAAIKHTRVATAGAVCMRHALLTGQTVATWRHKERMPL